MSDPLQSIQKDCEYALQKGPLDGEKYATLPVVPVIELINDNKRLRGAVMELANALNDLHLEYLNFAGDLGVEPSLVRDDPVNKQTVAAIEVARSTGWEKYTG